MKALILYSGHLGSTRSAAEYLAKQLNGAEVLSTAEKQKVNFADYDVVIFGTNMRMFRLNKLFKKYACRAKKTQANSYVFLLGADEKNAEKNAEKVKAYVNNCKLAVYIGGVLDSTNAKGFAKSVIDNIVSELNAEGKPLPSINYSKLDELAEKINLDNQN